MPDQRRARALKRMDEITGYYAKQPGVIAVAAFGSNAERERFDAYSDLDFLVICEAPEKQRLLDQVERLETLCPVDGLLIFCKDAVNLLFSDGVLCDFGIVTPDLLPSFPHGAGRILWARSGEEPPDVSAVEPEREPERALADAALFSLYVGCLRERRGEKAAAFYEIQVRAAQKVLALIQGEDADAFSPFRHAEWSVPQESIARMTPGYGRSLEAAAYMLKQLKPQEKTPLYRAVFSLLD